METYQHDVGSRRGVQYAEDRHSGAVVRKMLMDCYDVAHALGIGVSTVWAWSKEGRLPQPIKLGAKTTRWKVSEIENYVYRQ